jgi:alpha-ribazole phosphatase
MGWTDVGLGPEGRRQAEALVGRFEGCQVDAVYSSDLRRARETAAPLAQRRGLSIEATADLREIDFGAWEGRRLEELWLESPEEARAWEAALRRVPSSFGETFEQLEARVARFARRLGAGAEVVVAHRGPLAVLYALLAGVSLEGAWRLPFDLGSVTPVSSGPAPPGSAGSLILTPN